MSRMHADEIEIDEPLVRRLLGGQAPELARLPIRPVEPRGTDNAIWRLGTDLVVRLPRIWWAVDQPELEARWLPLLATHLGIDVPEPVLLGRPTDEYPHPWSIHRWIAGEPASLGRMQNPIGFAADLARVVRELGAVALDDAPPARGRARPLADYDEETRTAIASAAHLIDCDAATGVWEAALAAPPHNGAATWVHGDLEGNCLLRGGRLAGLVDWGTACAGDPAVDVQVVWGPLFIADSRRVFLQELDADEATLARSRGAAIHQACAALPYYLDSHPAIVERSRHKLTQLGVAVR